MNFKNTQKTLKRIILQKRFLNGKQLKGIKFLRGILKGILSRI